MQGGGQNAAPQGNQQVSSSEIPNSSTVSQPSEQTSDQVTEGNAPGQSGVQEITNDERVEMEARIVDWLSEDNLERASGKTRDEIFDEFGNKLEPIAYIPTQYISLVSRDLKDQRIYCGKGYFIDHALRNHAKGGKQLNVEDVDVSKYLNIQSVLDNPDSVKETYVDGKRTVVFIKKIGRYFAELTQVEEDGKIVLHKSMFDQKKEPYAKLDDIRSKGTSSEGGVSSISHTAEAAPAISLESRGDVVSNSTESSASEDINSVFNSQENAEKSGEIAENGGETSEEQRGKSKEESESAPEIQEPRSVEENLDNGDKRITNYNSRGEVATVAIERDGKVVSVDSYDEGVLFEHTEYDGNGKATSVTRYDKQGNVVGTQVYEDGKAKTPMQKLADQVLARAEDKQKAKKGADKIDDVGEKIGGAKKDRFAEGMARIKAELEETDETLTDKLAKLPVSQVFNFDLEKLREGGISNEAISFIKIVKDYLPAKPRKTYKIRSWVNNTLALYKLCLEAGTNWDRVNTLLNGPQFTSSSLKEQFDAYIAIGGFDSGMNVGNAKLRQLDNKSGRYDENGKFVTLEGKWYVRDAGKHGGIYDTKDEAVNALKAFAGDKAGVTSSGKKKEVKFAVYQRRQDKSIFIAVKGKSDIVIQDGFASSKEAFDYIEANNAELQERYRALLDKTNADFEDNRPREGRDYRDGKDIPAEEFRTTFGFRGVEFGNWMTQEDRRKALNECYDALMDLAAVCKVSPQALSLGGTLGMAFGARGGGRFSAHYEPGKLVINLTKTKGAGSLAHEWFHALDNYFAKMGSEGLDVYATAGEGLFPEGISSIGKRYYDRKSGQMLTEDEYNERMNSHEVRQEMADAWKSLMETLKKSDYYKRSAAYAGLHNSKYWARPTELGARAFSTWVENELSKQGANNDYLANNPRFLVSEATDEQSRFMPYPFDADATWMEEAFGNLFEVMQEKTVDGQTVLYSIGEDYLLEEKETEAFKRATKTTMEAVERLKANGLEVKVVSEEEANAMIELAEMQRIKSPETALPEDESSFKGTVISSDDGANILKDIDNAIAEYENKGNSAKTFIGDVARILRAVRHGSKSEYADIVTANGIPVRIRLADHNVKVLNYDNAGINNGISIVISRKPNKGITNNGDAHLVEFFYSDKKISKADGKPLVEILKSIKQALYSGEYKDNTGLAVREEVNIPEMMTVFHGSGAQFDRFDHTFMGTGEGAQAFGWGFYVTEVEGIGRTYATTMRDKLISEKHKENAIINKLAKQTLESSNGNKEEALDYLRGLLNESWSDKKRVKAQIKIIETGKFLPETKQKANLYTVEIPDDNGSNYLHWDKPINGEIQERIANGLQSIGFEIEPGMNHLAYSRDGKIAVLNINAKGKDLYAELSEALGGDKAASLFLNNLGFVGISYPANATTGGRADGARNYVIFNEGDAVIENRVEFLRTAGGKIYGWAVDGKIYLTPDGINPNSPVHEYTHLWAADVEKNNPKLWNEVVEAMKLSPVWNEVANDANYSNIHGNDSRMASEVLARLSGRENYRRTMEQAKKEIEQAKTIEEKAEKISQWAKIKAALKNFWNWVQNIFRKKENATGPATKEMQPWDEFVNSAIGDFYKGKNPNVKESPLEGMFVGEKGAANLDRAEEATTRLDNLAVAREMETAGKEAKAIKLATGWERGADGKWRYETEDYTLNQDAKVYDVYNGVERPFSDFFVRDGARGFIDTDYSLRLDELINDKELFAAYPELEQFFVSVERLASGTMGELNFDDKVIRLGRERVHLVPNVINGKRSYKVEVGSVLAHEIQHAIQHIEGFALGGNPYMAGQAVRANLPEKHQKAYGILASYDFMPLEKARQWAEHPDAAIIDEAEPLKALIADVDAGKVKWEDIPNWFSNDFNNYRRLAGEVESRNVQKRMGMSPEERRNSLAEETYMNDVARKDQIFIYENLGESAMIEQEKQRPFHEMIDDLYNNENVDKSKYARTYFHVAETPDFMASIGLSGAEFTIPFKAISTHIGKDSDHYLDANIWHNLPEALQHPFLVTKYGKDDRFRIYTTLMHDGKYVAVGVDVKRINQGRNKPIIEINSIKTVFAKTGKIGENETVVCYDERITPEQEALLDGRNFRQYPTIQELSASKDNISSADLQGESENFSQEGEARFRTIAEVERIDSESVKAIESLSQELNTPTEVVTDIESIADERKKRDAKKGMKGWFDPKTGKVVVVLPNVSDTQDAVETMLHEAVGHRGLRALFGKRYNDFLNQVFAYGSLHL